MRKDRKIVEKFKLKTAVWNAGKLFVEELTFNNFSDAYNHSKKIKGYSKIYNQLEEVIISNHSNGYEEESYC